MTLRSPLMTLADRCAKPGFLRNTMALWVAFSSFLVDAPARAVPSAEAGTEMEWVTVGDPDNPADSTGHGVVEYPFEIGKFEVTVGQWVEFLNAVARQDSRGLWKPEMGDAGLNQFHSCVIERSGESGAYVYRALEGRERFPMVFVTLADAMRFANWLHHGKGAGDTETGAYDLRGGKIPVTRTPEAKFWVPNEEEWYKAAYYHPKSEGGPEHGYWLYPTRSQEPPVLERKGGEKTQSASFLDPNFQGTNYAFLIPVGSHPKASSHYGTFDQGGSVWEWTETPLRGAQRILRGGSVTKHVAALRSVMRVGCEPRVHQRDVGFRLARRLILKSESGVLQEHSGNRDGQGIVAEANRLFEEACMDCHDQETRKGGLDLSILKWEPQTGENARIWTQVLDKVRDGEMPPPKKSRPEANMVRSFVQQVGGALHQESVRKQEREGRVVYRRLNRREYLQTIRDLFDVHLPLEDLLPPDSGEGGFDTVGSALQLSSAHLERYLEAADRVVRAASFLRPAPAVREVETDFIQTWLTKAERQQNGWSFSPEGYLAIRAHRGNGGRNLDWRPDFPNARYRFTVRARAMLDDAGEAGGAGKAVNRTSPETVGQAGLPIFKLWPKAGPDPRMTLAIGLAPAGGVAGLERAKYYEASPDEFREFVYEGRVLAGYTLQVSPYRIIPDEMGEEGGKYHGMCAVIESVKIEGPLFDEWPPRGHRLMYGDIPLVPAAAQSAELVLGSTDPETDVRRILSAALPRLFRRPLADAELEDYLELFRQRIREGTPLDAAIRQLFKMALCSDEFLFLAEKPGRLDDYALAARLSLAFWGTVPDEMLMRLAAQGRLGRPEVLREQTERLLGDPRAERFARNFLANWLNLREIDATNPDTKLYTEFEAQLQESLLAESEAFWMVLVRENLGVTNVVHSRFAMLNERLAEHYGIPGVRGEHLRKVALAGDSRRGGFLTQGAVLKVSANGTVTSPVVRGAYVLDRFLGTPPEPPPKNVPAIEPDIRGATTIRAQLEKHRSDAACAGCHSKMDPPGFALESYDVTGRWRSHYRILSEENREKIVTLPGAPYRLFVQGPAVQPEATMADGFQFDDVEGFKRHLLANPKVLARCLVQKLTVHLTGASLQFADREVVEAILKDTESDGYGIRSLIHGIVQSRMFTHK